MLKKHLTLIIFLIGASSGLKSQIAAPQYRFGSEQYLESKAFYDDGMIRPAENKIIQMIKGYPASPAIERARLLQADIDLTLGNYIIAERILNEFIKENPNSPLVPFAAFQRGVVAFEQQRYPQAEIYFKQSSLLAEQELGFLKTNEMDSEKIAELAHASLFWQGISLALQGKYQDAKPVFRDCAQKYPEQTYADDAIFALGQTAEINRNYEKALVQYRQIAMFYPGANTYLASKVRAANTNLVLRNFPQALIALEDADITIGHINAKDSIGLLFEKQTYVDNVREDILYLRGESYNLSGNYDRALLSFKAFLETFSSSDLLNYVKLGAGWALLNKGEYDAALGYYNDVIGISDGNDNRAKPIAQLYRIIALKRKGNIELARHELSALSVQPAYPFLGQALLELGQLYYEEGDYELARRTLERADREALDAIITARINLLLGATYMEQELWSKAVQEYRKAARLAENSSEVFMPKKHWYIAEARLKQGISLVQSHRSAEAIPPLLAYIGSNESNRQGDEALYWLAEAYFRSDLLKNAAETYASMVDIYPTSDRREEALYGLGWSHLRQKQFKQSSKIFDKLIKEFPRTKYSTEVLARQGDGYYYVKNYAKAAESYRRASFLAPNSEEGQYASYQLCFSLYKLRRYEESISALLGFVRQNSKSSLAPYSLYLMGWIRFQQKRYNEAIDDFHYLIQAYPNSGLLPRIHYAIADCYYNQGKYEEAMKTYKYIVLSYPSNPLAPEAMKSVQQCLIILGRTDEAAALLDTFITENDESPYVIEFRWKKADMFYTGGKYGDAVTAYDDFIRKHPNSVKSADAIYWMGKSYTNLNENEKAIDAFNKLRQKYPDSDFAPMGLLEQGLLYKKMADIEKADSVLIALGKYYPAGEAAAQAGFERAILKYNIGDTTSSIRIYREVADSFPCTNYSDQSRYRLGMYYRSKGMNDSARAEFRILAQSEFNPLIASEAQYRIGELWVRNKEYESAIEALKTVRDNFSGYEDWFSLALLALGESYENIEDWTAAREAYQSLQALRPDDDFGKTAGRRLKRIRNK